MDSSVKLIMFFVFVLFVAAIYDGITQNNNRKANFKEEKGSVIVLIKASKSNRSITPYKIYLRDSVGNLKDYRITNYEKSLINLGDTIK